MNSSYTSFQKFVKSPAKFWLFCFAKLPSAFFAGVKILNIDEHSASVCVKEKWFCKNPFGSIYFAILAMTAEVSTGVLCLGAVYKRKPAISMLVVKQEGQFYKKAKGKIVFTCNDGLQIMNAVEACISSNESRSVTCHTKGFDENNILVAEFYFTWSFKAKSK